MPPRKKTNISVVTRSAKRSKLYRSLETPAERELRLERVREYRRAVRARQLEERRTRAQEEEPETTQAQPNALVESNPGLYKPTLWYYKHLNFLSGNAEPTSDDSDSDNNDDDTLYVQLPRAQKRPASTSIDQLDAQGTSVDASAAAFGRSVGAQLHYLSKMQRCIAEKLISDVIYHAKMEQLSLDSTINVKDNLDASLTLMAEADPSIYGTALETSTSIQQPTSSTELTPEELVKREIAETESAVSFIKMEHNDTENYFFHDDEHNDDIDIVKEELM